MNLWWVSAAIAPFAIGWIIARLAWDKSMRSAIAKRVEKREELGLSQQSEIGAPEIGEQVRYHNNAIYSDVRFFIKVSLAIVAAVAAVLCSACQGLLSNESARNTVIVIVGVLELLSGLLLFVSVRSHQKAKIVWWWREPKVQEIPDWQETWMVPLLVGVSGGLAFAMPLLSYALS